MKWLSVVGQAILKGCELVVGLQHSGAVSVPAGVIDVVNEIETAITQVEVAGTVVAASGDQKMQMAAPLIGQILLRSSSWTHFKVADDKKTLFLAGCQKIAAGFADVLNSRES